MRSFKITLMSLLTGFIVSACNSGSDKTTGNRHGSAVTIDLKGLKHIGSVDERYQSYLWAKLMGKEVYEAGNGDSGVYSFEHDLKGRQGRIALLIINTRKCTVHFLAALGNAIETYQPVALLYNNQLTDMAEKIIGLVPGGAELPRHNVQEITIIEKPECPEKDDYTYDDDDEPVLDKDEFNEAMDNYHSELEAYNLHIKSGHYAIGIFLGNKEFMPVHFSMEKPKPLRNGLL